MVQSSGSFGGCCCSLWKALIVLCLFLPESVAFLFWNPSGTILSSKINSIRTKKSTNDPNRLHSAKSIWRPGFRLSASTAVEDMTSVTYDEDFIQMYSNNECLNENPVEAKVGILLLNLGGPEKTADVQGFLYNLFADPDIIRLPPFLSPLQSFIAYIISKRRAPKSIKAYESIGGGSPILKYSNDQAALIAKSLKDKYDLDVKTYIGMRYWYPFTEEALKQIEKDKINALVIVPLYPQFSISTSGSSLRILQEEFSRRQDIWGEKKMSHTVIPSWYDRPGYVRSMANIIQRELDSFTPSQVNEQLKTNPIGKHILFSAHGVPQSYIAAGDPYQKQIVECVEAIKRLLPSEEEGVKVHLSYQSRVGPIEWLRPYTDDVLPELGEKGVKNLVVVPISFVSEHIETLEEIDIEYRELAEESGITNWRRAPALNTDASFIEDMADMVYESLYQPAQSVTEACVANNVGLVNIDVDDISSAGVGGVGANDELQSQNRLKGEERFYGRIAIVAIATTILMELMNGKSIGTLFGN